MSDWYDDLAPPERDDFDAFVDHFRKDALQKIVGSSVFTSLLPTRDEGDPKFWMELGAAIMYDKPLLVLAQAGSPPPPKLAMIADRIIEVELDTEDGQRRAAVEIKAALRELVGAD